MQAQVGIGGRGNWRLKIDFGANHLNIDVAAGIVADQRVELLWHHPERVGLRRVAKLRVWIPNVEHG